MWRVVESWQAWIFTNMYFGVITAGEMWTVLVVGIVPYFYGFVHSSIN